MNKVALFLFSIFTFIVCRASAQRSVGDEKVWLKNQVAALSGAGMYGRGYVNGGRDSAALYVLKKFKEFKLQPVAPKGPMAQAFAFPVNTFPGKMELVMDGDKLKAGVDFIIDPSSASFSGEKIKVEKLNLGKIKNEEEWQKTLRTIDSTHAYILEDVDALCTLLDLQKTYFTEDLPAACYIIPGTGRMTWRVSRTAMAATVFYVKEDLIPKKLRSLSVDVTSMLIEHAHCENIIACAPGKIKDSFVVFCSHYDHLGMMGDSTIYEGASDNASGVALMLSLASYYAAHPQRYSILFIAFSGQTAGLMGSEYYKFNPFVPLANIKFLTDIGMVGNATRGITVVNATERPVEFDLLDGINQKQKYIPDVIKKGPAANSDHFHFAKAGVPCFFIYANGGNMYYHDVMDTPKEVAFDNINGVEKLLMEFVKALN